MIVFRFFSCYAGDNFTLLDNGPASDTALGYEFGAAYDFSDFGLDGLSVGAVYKSELNMNYNNTISASVAAFETLGSVGISSGDNLDQPAEMGIGLAYTFGEHTVAFDYKTLLGETQVGLKTLVGKIKMCMLSGMSIKLLFIA